MSDQPKCQLCGEPMPEGEEMFQYHGYSGPCPAKHKPGCRSNQNPGSPYTYCNCGAETNAPELVPADTPVEEPSDEVKRAAVAFMGMVTPPAPPGLDLDLEAALDKEGASPANCHAPWMRRVWDTLNEQHLAALQQARKDERAQIVKAVREKAGDTPNDPALDTDYEVGWYGGMTTAADFIETLEETP